MAWNAIFPGKILFKMLKPISENIIVFICDYATCAIYGKSGTNCIIA